MNRRWISLLLYVLVVAQVSAFVPAAVAGAGGSAASATHVPCAGDSPDTDHSKPCPCCPDGAKGMAGCLSACAASVAVAPMLWMPAARSKSEPVIATGFAPRTRSTDPPLKPPPIA